MGQTSSRNRANEPTGQSAVVPAAQPEPESHPPPTHDEQSRHRRTSVRKSILNLVKHRSSRSLNGTDDSVSSPRSRLRRHSRRWDKSVPAPDTAATTTNAVTTSEEAGPSATPESPTAVLEQKEDPLPEPEIQAIELPAVMVEGPADPGSTSQHMLIVPPQDTTGNLGERTEAGDEIEAEPSSSISLANRLGLSRTSSTAHAHVSREDEAEVVISTPQDSQNLPISPETQATLSPEPSIPIPPTEPQNQPQSQPQTQPPLNRQFPPPGTLVVVQGVVHTTDMPRPPSHSHEASTSSTQSASSNTIPDIPQARRRASSTPRPSTPAGTERTGARNRLSALLRSRPASMISQRPASTSSDRLGISSTSNPSAAQLSDTPGVLADASSTTDSAAVGPPAETESSTSPSANAASTTANPSDAARAISSSSIDVLGTLLSVAAAATAASLLTGSSDPMLNSGFQAPQPAASSPTPLPGPGPSDSPSTPEPQIRPMSPTPTAGLGGGGNSALEGSSTGGRSERMRQAWASIRERLGLRPSGPAPSNNDGSTRGGANAADNAIIDGRERMLAEMARAFNLGLGINGDNADGANPPTATSASGTLEEAAESNIPPPSSTLPPEGSFERFLIDLQIDLRVALTQTSNPAAASTEPTPGHEPPTEPDNTPSLGNLDTEGLLSQERRRASDSSEDEDEVFDDAEDELPGSAEEEGGDANSPNTADNPSGRINWWRLYRFPAIPTPRLPPLSDAGTDPLPASATSTDVQPPPFDSPTPSQPERPSTDIPLSSGETLPSQQPPSTTTPTPSPRTVPNVVIPVIVVGLQSVSLRLTPPAEAPVDGTTTPRPSDPSETPDVDPDTPSTPTPELSTRRPDTPIPGDGLDDIAGPASHRGRRWHSRAASAFRNLRGTASPSTRQPAQGTPLETEGGLGTRTFLIYVIGGYYPPDHSIVTGESNTLDSFEALMELAELIGQAKPPTASKEEIEKSGLEVIKASTVSQYETEKKISSNCTERCLICLDEYAEDDDVRVMKCRHAFHQSCVDTWLQTGKNNCPACRSRGVTTESPLSPPPPSTPTTTT